MANFTNGKHSGKTLEEVVASDAGYIVWLFDNNKFKSVSNVEMKELMKFGVELFENGYSQQSAYANDKIVELKKGDLDFNADDIAYYENEIKEYAMRLADIKKYF